MTKKKAVPAHVRRLRWLTVGVIGACYLESRFLAPVLGLVLGAAGLLFLRKREWRSEKRWCVLGASLILLWMGCYALLFLSPVRTYYGEKLEFSAVVTDYPAENRYNSSVPITFRPDHALPVHGIAYIHKKEVILPGDVLHLSAEIADPTGNSMDDAHYYRSQGVFFAAKKVDILSVERPAAIPVRFWHKTLRLRLKEQINGLFPDEMASFFTALLTGDQSELSDVLSDKLQRLGMRHIIAVSGLHIAFLTALFMKLPLPVQLREWISVPVLVGFCLVTGGRPSVFRAVVMGVCLLLAPTLRRESDPWSSMRAALFILLFLNPFCIEDVGLQLSFLSVSGILLFSRRIHEWLMEHSPKAEGKIGTTLKKRSSRTVAATLGALSLTMPLSALCFGRISLIAPLANLLTLWAVELGFAFGFLAAAFSFVLPGVGGILAVFARFFLGIVLFFVQLMTEMGYYAAITSDVFLYSLWLLALYAVLALLILRPRMRKHLRSVLIGLSVSLGLVLYFHRGFLLNGGLAVQVLDVEQGQSILALSENEAAAIDCGGYQAGTVLSAHMEDVGEYQLDLLVLTHLDSDHTNGLPVLMEEVRVKKILIPASQDAEKMEELLTLAASYDTEVEIVERDTVVPFGSASLQCFAPVEQEEGNNGGLSALIGQEGYSVLVTGDMDSKSEECFLERHDLTADALVVGHHGSASSTGQTLLEKVQPRTAVISVGKGNPYGHPSEKTLTRLEEAGCTVYRTDKDGTVTLKK